MKILITGICGFVGGYLTELCLREGNKVFGWHHSNRLSTHLEEFKGGVKVDVCDLRDKVAVVESLKNIKPDTIFHFSGKSHVGKSWQHPRHTFETNINGQINLLEAIRESQLTSRVIIAGSSEEYGIVKQDAIPVNENHFLEPVSPYAVSKVTQDLMGYQYHKNYNLDVIRTRPFNQTGPRRSEDYVTSAFAKQVALIEAGKKEPTLSVGNLDAIRDFTDVRDSVKAFWLLAKKGEAGSVYNICSGIGYKILDILTILRDVSGVKFDVVQDPSRTRPSDLPILIGDPTRSFEATGWKPEISFENSMKDLLDYWRKNI